jgi:hypothetical protein
MRGVVQPADGTDIVTSVIGVREVIVKAETGEIHRGDGEDDDGEGNDDKKAQTGAPSDHDANGIIRGPDEERQVDYGDGPMVRDPVTGKYRRMRLFVFTLGYSRKSVRLLTFINHHAH